MLDSAREEFRNVADWERTASGLGGAALLAYGLARRPSLGSIFMAVAGAALLERGLSGHCSLYQAAGLNSREQRPAARHRRDPVERFDETGHPAHADEVERASDDSFPASDPPSWSPHRAGSPVATH
jgi:hypothetical protein